MYLQCTYNMNKKKTKIIQMRLSEGESKMINELCQRFSCSVSDLVRGWLRYNHKKTFPAYRSRKSMRVEVLEKDLTPEQACEQAGGRVEIQNGVPMCVFQMSPGLKRNIPISRPELYPET